MSANIYTGYQIVTINAKVWVNVQQECGRWEKKTQVNMSNAINQKWHHICSCGPVCMWQFYHGLRRNVCHGLKGNASVAFDGSEQLVLFIATVWLIWQNVISTGKLLPYERSFWSRLHCAVTGLLSCSWKFFAWEITTTKTMRVKKKKKRKDARWPAEPVGYILELSSSVKEEEKKKATSSI